MSESAIRAYAANKRFGGETLARWLACSAADQGTLLALVERLRLGENQVRDLLDALQAIGARRRCTFADIVSDAAVQGVLSAGHGRNETLHQLKQVLRRLRFPQLVAAETRLASLVRGLGLPAGVTVTLPENLEGDDIVVAVRAGSAPELRRRLAALNGAMAGAALDEMYELLAGKW